MPWRRLLRVLLCRNNSIRGCRQVAALLLRPRAQVLVPGPGSDGVPRWWQQCTVANSLASGNPHRDHPSVAIRGGEVTAKQLQPGRYLRAGDVRRATSGFPEGERDQLRCDVVGIDRLDTKTRRHWCHKREFSRASGSCRSNSRRTAWLEGLSTGRPLFSTIRSTSSFVLTYPHDDIRSMPTMDGCTRCGSAAPDRCLDQIPRRVRVPLCAGGAMNDCADTAHRGIDALPSQQVSGEERRRQRGVARAAGEHTNVATGIDQPGHDMSPQAAGTAGDEDRSDVIDRYGRVLPQASSHAPFTGGLFRSSPL